MSKPQLITWLEQNPPADNVNKAASRSEEPSSGPPAMATSSPCRIVDAAAAAASSDDAGWSTPAPKKKRVQFNKHKCARLFHALVFMKAEFVNRESILTQQQIDRVG
jgi:hypothetical protein